MFPGRIHFIKNLINFSIISLSDKSDSSVDPPVVGQCSLEVEVDNEVGRVVVQIDLANSAQRLVDGALVDVFRLVLRGVHWDYSITKLVKVIGDFQCVFKSFTEEVFIKGIIIFYFMKGTRTKMSFELFSSKHIYS